MTTKKVSGTVKKEKAFVRDPEEQVEEYLANSGKIESLGKNIQKTARKNRPRDIIPEESKEIADEDENYEETEEEDLGGESESSLPEDSDDDLEIGEIPKLDDIFARAPKKVYNGNLLENKVYVWGKADAEEIYDLGCFGKVEDDKNELSLEEALLLMKRNKLKVTRDDKEMSVEDFYKHSSSIDKEFPWKFKVYDELRSRGLLVRTGFKFGTHFRVYGRGVKLKRGPKSVKEHTKWIVHSIPENYTCSFPELSRAVRLAHNIRAKMLWAVVDEEGDVTYYEVLRKTP